MSSIPPKRKMVVEEDDLHKVSEEDVVQQSSQSEDPDYEDWMSVPIQSLSHHSQENNNNYSMQSSNPPKRKMVVEESDMSSEDHVSESDENGEATNQNGASDANWMNWFGISRRSNQWTRAGSSNKHSEKTSRQNINCEDGNEEEEDTSSNPRVFIRMRRTNIGRGWRITNLNGVEVTTTPVSVTDENEEGENEQWFRRCIQSDEVTTSETTIDHGSSTDSDDESGSSGDNSDEDDSDGGYSAPKAVMSDVDDTVDTGVTDEATAGQQQHQIMETPIYEQPSPGSSFWAASPANEDATSSDESDSESEDDTKGVEADVVSESSFSSASPNNQEAMTSEIEIGGARQYVEDSKDVELGYVSDSCNQLDSSKNSGIEVGAHEICGSDDFVNSDEDNGSAWAMNHQYRLEAVGKEETEVDSNDRGNKNAKKKHISLKYEAFRHGIYYCKFISQQNQNRWPYVEVLRKRNRKVYIHYPGYHKAGDEWVDEDLINFNRTPFYESRRRSKRGESDPSEHDRYPRQIHNLKEKLLTVKAQEEIVFGDRSMHPWFKSLYPKPIGLHPVIYICCYCLTYTECEEKHRRHHENEELCAGKPPGRVIYDTGKMRIYEINGWEEAVFCQCLCLLSAIYLESKTAIYRVECFLFYVLTEASDFGWRVMGYFSKSANVKGEESLVHDANLSCIMVLPIYQRRGYGSLLIDLSYQLSMIEKRYSGPERPLSALGQCVYLNYWIYMILRQLEGVKGGLQIEALEKSTGICMEDIRIALKMFGFCSFQIGQLLSITSQQVQSVLKSFKKPPCLLEKDKLTWTQSSKRDLDAGVKIHQNTLEMRRRPC